MLSIQLIVWIYIYEHCFMLPKYSDWYAVCMQFPKELQSVQNTQGATSFCPYIAPRTDWSVTGIVTVYHKPAPCHMSHTVSYCQMLLHCHLLSHTVICCHTLCAPSGAVCTYCTASSCTSFASRCTSTGLVILPPDDTTSSEEPYCSTPSSSSTTERSRWSSPSWPCVLSDSYCIGQ